MSYVGKLMARHQQAGMNHVNYQYGASNRAMLMQQQLFEQQMMQQMMMYQMMNQPQYTVQTHENSKHRGFFGGLWDTLKAGVGAYTGQQIGGYKDTITTSGGWGANQSYTFQSNGSWGESLGSLAGSVFGGSSQKTGSTYRPNSITYNQQQSQVASNSSKTGNSDNHKTECTNLKSLTGYNVIYQDGSFMATSKDGTTSIEASTFAEMRDALLADKRTNTAGPTDENLT